MMNQNMNWEPVADEGKENVSKSIARRALQNPKNSFPNLILASSKTSTVEEY